MSNIFTRIVDAEEAYENATGKEPTYLYLGREEYYALRDLMGRMWAAQGVTCMGMKVLRVYALSHLRCG